VNHHKWDSSWTGKKRTCPDLKHATAFFWDEIPDDESLRQDM
jgi:hypothetical protein